MERAPRDSEIAGRLPRLGMDGTQPKHLRIMGGYLLFATAVLAGINMHSWSDGRLWPKALIIAPALLLLGVWLLVDANALTSGTRRHQKPILWACIGIGSVVGLAILHTLTGSFF